MKSIRVSAAIIHDGGSIYATRRGKGTFKGGWEFPGGKREAGESGEDAIVREIHEELGAFFMTMDCYLCHIKDGQLTLSEHDAAKWLPLEEIDSLDWLPADLKVVEAIKKHFS